jgi:flagellar assembly protein FliH
LFRIDKASVDISADPAKIDIAQEVPEAPIGQEPLVDALTSAIGQQSAQAGVEAILREQEQQEEPAAAPPPPQMDEEEAEDKAQQIIQQAEERAAQMIKEAEEQAQSVHDAAAQKGYDDGREEVNNLFAGQVQEEKEAFQTLMQGVTDEFNRITQQGNIAAAKLAISIAEKIIGFELDRNDMAYLSIAQQTVERIHGSGKLVMRVSPEDYARFFAEGQTLAGLPSDIQLEIVQDKRVKKGGCIVETGSESVNGGVDKQLERTAQAFDVDDGKQQL